MRNFMLVLIVAIVSTMVSGCSTCTFTPPQQEQSVQMRTVDTRSSLERAKEDLEVAKIRLEITSYFLLDQALYGTDLLEAQKIVDFMKVVSGEVVCSELDVLTPSLLSDMPKSTERTTPTPARVQMSSNR